MLAGKRIRLPEILSPNLIASAYWPGAHSIKLHCRLQPRCSGLCFFQARDQGDDGGGMDGGNKREVVLAVDVSNRFFPVIGFEAKPAPGRKCLYSFWSLRVGLPPLRVRAICRRSWYLPPIADAKCVRR